MNEGMYTKGILRVNGSEARIKKELVPIFNSPPTFGSDYNLDNCSIHDVSSLIKKYFRDLATPLIPPEYLRLLMSVNGMLSLRS
jgi:hypothetical protein